MAGAHDDTNGAALGAAGVKSTLIRCGDTADSAAN